MQIPKNLLRVIFMLSTIVAVTDCCSSRILLLKDHTLNLIHQHKIQQYQQQQDQQNTNSNEKYQQYIHQSGTAGSGLDKSYNKNHSDTNADDAAESETATDENNTDIAENGEAINLDRPPPLPALPQLPPLPHLPLLPSPFGQSYAESAVKVESPDPSDPAVRKNTADNKQLQIVDIYLSIMSDILSFPCTGQYLTDFCLNGGRCFRYPLGNHSLFSCQCADGYVGERCESKSVNGSFVPHPAGSSMDSNKPRILTARVVFSFPMLIFLTFIYIGFGLVIVFKCQPSPNYKYKYSPTHIQTSRAAGLLFT